MPTVRNSTVYTSQIGAGGQSLNVGTLPDRDTQGKQRYAIVTVTALGTEVTGDSYRLLKLPAGCKVLAVDCSIIADATVGTGVTVRIGDQTTVNRWAGTIDISAGGYFAFTATLGTEVVVPVAIAGGTDDIVTLTFVAITSITAAKRITILMSYLLQ
jgi:hypothetical protein